MHTWFKGPSVSCSLAGVTFNISNLLQGNKQTKCPWLIATKEMTESNALLTSVSYQPSNS